MVGTVRAGAAALVCAAAPAGAQAGARFESVAGPPPSAELPSLGAGRVATQVLLGVPAGAAGYVAGGLATRFVARRLGATEGEASALAEKGVYVGIAAFTAVPPALVGARGPGSGRYVAALGGAAAGELAGALVVRLARPRYGGDRPCGALCKAAGALVFVLPSVGATAGYNLSRRR